MSAPAPFDHADQTGTSDFSFDPLLAAGSFISSTTGGDRNPGDGLKRRPNLTRGKAFGPAESSEMMDGTNQAGPPLATADNTAPPAESKTRRRSTPVENWLPPGWTVEDRVRTSGATAGSVDKYYYDPVSGRKFRSKNEVLYYLEHGTPKKGKKSENSDVHSDPSEGNKQNKSGKKAREVPLNFDFLNPPEKVNWVLTNEYEETWTPFIGDTKVKESASQDWAAAFTMVTTKNGGQLTF